MLGKHFIAPTSGQSGTSVLCLRVLSSLSQVSQPNLMSTPSPEPLTTFTGMVGLAKGSDDVIGIAFDILALEALFLVPRFVRRYRSRDKFSKLTDPSRICSLLSLNPYFGTLVSNESVQIWHITDISDPLPTRNGVCNVIRPIYGQPLILRRQRTSSSFWVLSLFCTWVRYCHPTCHGSIGLPASNILHRISDYVHTSGPGQFHSARNVMDPCQGLLWVCQFFAYEPIEAK